MLIQKNKVESAPAFSQVTKLNRFHFLSTLWILSQIYVKSIIFIWVYDAMTFEHFRVCEILDKAKDTWGDLEGLISGQLNTDGGPID